MRLDRNPLNLAFLGDIYAWAGDHDQARALLEQLDEMSKRRYVCPYETSTIYIGLGEFDEAFKWLDRAVIDKSGCIPWLRADARMDPIRDDARFTELLIRTGHSAP